MEWVGEPQLSLPLLMPQKRILLWPAPLPIPHVQFLLRGGGVGDLGRGCSVSGPQEGEGHWGRTPHFTCTHNTDLPGSRNRGSRPDQASLPALDYRRKGLVLGAGGPGGIMGGRPGPPPSGEM